MKKLFTFLTVLVFAGTYIYQANAQMQVESFDNFPFTDSDYDTTVSMNGDNGTVELSSVAAADAIEGDGAGQIDYSAESANDWGGFVSYRFSVLSDGLWDWSEYNYLSIWYNNIGPQSSPERGHFRIELLDASDTTADVTDSDDLEVWYSFNYVLDDKDMGWTQLIIPLEDVGATAQTAGSSGFWQTGWAGKEGNATFDLDKIKGVIFEFSVAGPADEEEIIGLIQVDNLEVLKEMPEEPSGINSVAYSDLSVYPNPASDVVQFNSDTELAELQIINMAGQAVANVPVNGNQIDISALQAGVYYLIATDVEGNNLRQKLIVE